MVCDSLFLLAICIAKKLYLKSKVLNSSIARIRIKKYSRFYNTVQVGSQKYRRILKKKSYLTCSQIWLNVPVVHHHFGYNTKLPKKNHWYVTACSQAQGTINT